MIDIVDLLVWVCVLFHYYRVLCVCVYVFFCLLPPILYHRVFFLLIFIQFFFVTYFNGSVTLSLLIFVHFSVSFLRVKERALYHESPHPSATIYLCVLIYICLSTYGVHAVHIFDTFIMSYRLFQSSNPTELYRNLCILTWSFFDYVCCFEVRSSFQHLLSCHSFCHHTWHYIIILYVRICVNTLFSDHFSTLKKRIM